MITFITENLSGIITVLTAVVSLASAIAALTPSDTDNKVVKVFKGIVDKLALNVGNATPKGK
jgi:hypothetical protein